MTIDKDSKFWLAAIGAVLLAAAIVLVYMFRTTYSGDGDNFRLEASKLLLQFLLVGVGGGLVVAFLNHRRESAHRHAEKLAADKKAADDARAAVQARAAVRRVALQELIREIGDAHRRLKIVKRQLRAAIAREEPDPRDPPNRPYAVPAAAFEQAMDALLAAQIAAEQVRDRVGGSVDLLRRDQIDRIVAALRYGACYFHDAYEDYEYCRVKKRDDKYEVTPVCNNLHNFLYARCLPKDLPEEHRALLQDQISIMIDDRRPLPERHAALGEIRRLTRVDKDERRYRAVATEAFALAAEELRLALWHTCLEDPPIEAAMLPIPAPPAPAAAAA